MASRRTDPLLTERAAARAAFFAACRAPSVHNIRAAKARLDEFQRAYLGLDGDEQPAAAPKPRAVA